MSRQQECDACRELLGAWIDQALEGVERARVDAHLADCVACQAQLAALGAVDRALSSLEAPRVPDRDWSEVAERAWERAAAEGTAPVAAGREARPEARTEFRSEARTEERPGQGARQADWRERLREWLGLEGPWWRGLAPVMGVFLVAVLSWQVWTGRPEGTGSRGHPPAPAPAPQVAPVPRGEGTASGGDAPAFGNEVDAVDGADGVDEDLGDVIGEVIEEGRVPGHRLVWTGSGDAAGTASAEAPGAAPEMIAKSSEQIPPTSVPERESTPRPDPGTPSRKGTFDAFRPPSDTRRGAESDVSLAEEGDEGIVETESLPFAPPVSPRGTENVELAESSPPAQASRGGRPEELEEAAYLAGRGASPAASETAPQRWGALSVPPVASTANPSGFLLEGASPARLIDAHLGAGPQLPELIDAAGLLRAEEHADASALLDHLLAGMSAQREQRIVTLSSLAVEGDAAEADGGKRAENADRLVADRLPADVTDSARVRSDALRVDDGTLRVRARARYLLLVAGHDAGSPDDLAGLRQRLAETEQVADEFARLTEGRQARLWSAEIAYRIWTLTGDTEDCRAAERQLRAGIVRLENDPTLTRHLDRLLDGLDC